MNIITPTIDGDSIFVSSYPRAQRIVNVPVGVNEAEGAEFFLNLLPLRYLRLCVSICLAR